MDFTPTEAQRAVRAVACDALERTGRGPLPARWKELVAAGLLGLPVPQEYGGEGLGLDEVGVLLHEAGRRAVDLPVLETLACAALTLASHGTPEQKGDLLPRIATGESVVSVAVCEPGQPLAGPSRSLHTVLVPAAGGWTLTGRKVGVGHALHANRILVTAAVESGEPGPGAAGGGGEGPTERAVVLLDPRAPGVRILPTPASRDTAAQATETAEATLVLEDVAVTDDDVLGGWAATGEAAARLQHLAVAGLCLLADGLVAGARDLTAEYVRQRRQFDRSLAEFQAVSQQMADVYISSRSIGLAALSAAWRLGHASEAEAEDDLAVAAYWISVEAPTALHTCHHLHGGVGVDVTYPLHAHYSWVKDITRALGGSVATLEQVADRLVAPSPASMGGR